jgi:hypothetical protein
MNGEHLALLLMLLLLLNLVLILALVLMRGILPSGDIDKEVGHSANIEAERIHQSIVIGIYYIYDYFILV